MINRRKVFYSYLQQPVHDPKSERDRELVPKGSKYIHVLFSLCSRFKAYWINDDIKMLDGYHQYDLTTTLISLSGIKTTAKAGGMSWYFDKRYYQKRIVVTLVLK